MTWTLTIQQPADSLSNQGITMDSEQASQILAEADLLHSETEIDLALTHLAEKINLAFTDKDPLIYCVMNGGLIPAGMLLPRLTFPFKLDYLHATRYREKTTGGENLKWLKTSETDMSNRHVLVIDDILDEGYTLKAIADYCTEQGALSVATAVLAEKTHERGNSFKADFVGLQIIDRYVFGMGMDYRGYLRHLPAIYAVKGL